MDRWLADAGTAAGGPGPAGAAATRDDRDLRRLTEAERLFLWRFRQPGERRLGRGGPRMTQEEAGRALGLDQRAYARLEAGADVSMTDRGAAEAAARIAQVSGATAPELLRIARRRSGLGWREAAALVPIHPNHLFALEAAADPRLFVMWRRRGYAFPRRLDPVG